MEPAMTDIAARQVPLTRGLVALVDETDWPVVSQFKWRPYRGTSTWYAIADIDGHRVRMHRLILKPPDDVLVDHRNHNGLDNTRRNIRPCNNQQNVMNARAKRRGTSRFKGVCWHKASGKWSAEIFYNEQKWHLGLFVNEEDAARSYDRKAAELFGQFAYLNFPSEVSA
jgi:hypothetical protein